MTYGIAPMVALETIGQKHKRRRRTMTFDYTNGEKAKYMVSVYAWNVEDRYIYHTYKEAKAMFDKVSHSSLEEGTSVSLYDMIKDIKKAFYKF